MPLGVLFLFRGHRGDIRDPVTHDDEARLTALDRNTVVFDVDDFPDDAAGSHDLIAFLELRYLFPVLAFPLNLGTDHDEIDDREDERHLKQEEGASRPPLWLCRLLESKK